MHLGRPCLALSLLALAARASLAQCPTWSGPFSAGGMDDIVHAFAEFDDGSGARLYAAGAFTSVDHAPVQRVAAWNGSQWSAVGAGFDDDVYALEVFDDGSGPALYAAGAFALADGAPARGIARWNGSAWSAVGSGVDDATAYSIRALAVFDMGAGPELFATGHFRSLGGVDAFGTGRWNGTSWNHLGGGIGDYSTGYALEVFDDGSGPALYVGGFFDHAGPLAVDGLARWSAQGWSAIGGVGPFASNETVRALCAFDDGGGPALYVGGNFQSIGGVAARNTARWNGSAWSVLAGEAFLNTVGVRALAVFDDGNGPELYGAGHYAPQSAGLARWNGASWDELETDGSASTYAGEGSHALLPFDDGSGAALYVGGAFTSAGGVMNHNVARWRGGAFVPLIATGALDGEVMALFAVTEPSLGAGLYAGGAFEDTGSGPAAGIARWNGSAWSAVGGGVDGDVRALATYDDGSGVALYAAGNLSAAGGQPVERIARWDGSQWSALGAGIGHYFGESVSALAVYDGGSGPHLIAGGLIRSAGGIAVESIAGWDGASWSPLGNGLNTTWGDGYVSSLAVFDDGSGPALYAGGHFDQSSPVHLSDIARWNGTSWSRVGTLGTNSVVSALAVFDDGSGPALYAGGAFTLADSVPVNYVARWDGSAWSSVGAGLNGYVRALHVHDDGSGPALYAAGLFGIIGGAYPKGVARWNGTAWVDIGANIGSSTNVYALASFDDGSSAWPQLFVGGAFISAGGASSLRIARWSDPCVGQGASYCTAGTTSSGCVPTIASSGYASASAASGFTISVTNLEGQKQGHIFYGLSGGIANPWSPASTSYLCVKAPTQRTGTQDSGGTAGACNGSIAIDWNAYVASHPGALGAPFAAGTEVWAQLYFRDPPAPKTTNLSDGLHFVVTP